MKINMDSVKAIRLHMQLITQMKFRQPISLQELFLPTRRMNSEGMITPRVRLENSKNNFVFKASTILNKLHQYVFSKRNNNSERNNNSICILLHNYT